MAGNPANIGGAEKHFARLVLEHIGKSIAGVHHVASAGVHHAFWFTGRTRGI